MPAVDSTPSFSEWFYRRRRTRRVAGICGALVLAALLTARATQENGELWWHQRKVIGVAVDGPLTLAVVDAADRDRTTRLRLVGVAPLGDPRAMHRWLKQHCVGRTLTVSIQTAHHNDGSARAYLYGPNGELLNRSMIAAGAALADRDDPHRLSGWFARAQP